MGLWAIDVREQPPEEILGGLARESAAAPARNAPILTKIWLAAGVVGALAGFSIGVLLPSFREDRGNAGPDPIIADIHPLPMEEGLLDELLKND
jgi:hypothetical protein